jgi:hypothetical protein
MAKIMALLRQAKQKKTNLEAKKYEIGDKRKEF